ncbi:hypothetical protein CHS0354_010502 [Potamilus streckersoni]|uniref:Kringle domain-containing protein n=1 Tax=Potamilus streckersoni TaxID=2493646 RepID=A0AAE0T6C8_9BIVA|nr:hypothetical protein CHS0354_010502 [Potamilus streckersoni]
MFYFTATKPSRGDCFFRSSVYLGHISTTINNVTCDRWDVHLVPNDPLASKLPDQRLDDALNYCRDPDGKGHPWCYVKGNPVKTWDFCDVPYCQECYYANQSHMYNGYVSSTNNGECFNWTGFPDSSFIDGNKAKAKNYCRDPDHTGYPYCFTSSGLAQCTIPQCKGFGLLEPVHIQPPVLKGNE